LIRFFCGVLGVTRGRFLSMISSAAHPRWPLRSPSWIWFPSIRGQTPGSTGLIFWWLIGGDWRKVPFNHQHRRSSNIAATAAILDLVSVYYLTNACVDWSNFLWLIEVINTHHIPLLPKPYLPYTHRQLPTLGMCHALHSPCLYHVFYLESLCKYLNYFQSFNHQVKFSSVAVAMFILVNGLP
jgi:hypothetical protein